jgi:hypothetical protein
LTARAVLTKWAGKERARNWDTLFWAYMRELSYPAVPERESEKPAQRNSQNNGHKIVMRYTQPPKVV